jgi:hypothetical protein
MQEAVLAKCLTFLCAEHEIRAKTIRAALRHVRVLELKDKSGSRISLLKNMYSATGLFYARGIVQKHYKDLERTSSNDYMLLRVSYYMGVKHTECILPEDRI